ncbi:DUF1549 domain-containing protein, partial [Candidatus Sumerlaeota bacterium]|nr:DUF1549 domain-containing protein [Candidatus Sumerlaeota bacterium]
MLFTFCAFVSFGAVDFEKEVEPILESKCFSCHSPVKGNPKAGLRLDTAEGIMKGSKKNKVVVPGKPDDSLLYQRVKLPKDDTDLMPPDGKGDPLTQAEQDKVKNWIAEGCNFGSWKGKESSAEAPASPAADAAKPADSGSSRLHNVELLHQAALKAAGDHAVAALPAAPIKIEKSVKGAARQIDELVEANYKAQNVKPNPPADDATFIRRVYLDAAGRIPTYGEAKDFLESKSPDKRSEIINRILGSYAYESRQYDYWADLLRVQSRFRGISAGNYEEWIKDAIRKNIPYDQFVRDLLTAEGHVYQNGASGYYLRDSGMPLDNMANTVQLFLGTSLTCAQCHNHPFDKWSQKQFYEMSAFTAGVETVRRPDKDERRKYQEMAKLEVDNKVKQAAKNLVRRTRYGFVTDDPKRALRLPDNYMYDDAKPKAVVVPTAIFGEGVSKESLKDRRTIYAEWMTSPDNPRFTLNIANRLWKQVMGRGLIEPTDDIRDDSVASNPALMAYLTELMKSLKYDQKEFLRVLYNTQTYQRESSIFEGGDAVYHFPGPVMRRMTAEQMWDSFMTLIVPDVDRREGRRRDGYGESMEAVEQIMDMTPEELLQAAEAIANRREMRMQRKKDDPTELGSDEEMMPNAKLGKKGPKKISSALAENSPAPQIVLTGNEVNLNRAAKGGGRKAQMAERAQKAKRPAFRREIPIPPGFVRASELPQPAPPGHFLDQFGQSDRDT